MSAPRCSPLCDLLRIKWSQPSQKSVNGSNAEKDPTQGGTFQGLFLAGRFMQYWGCRACLRSRGLASERRRGVL